LRVAFLSIHGYVDPEPNLGLADTGGQVVYVLEMAKNLSKLGVKVDIFTRLFDNRKREEYVCESVRIIRIPCGPQSFVRKEDLFPYLDEFVKRFFLYISQEGIRYDAIHSHYWDAGYVALKLREKMNTLFVHTSHSLGLLKKHFLGEIGKKVDYKFDVRIRTEKEILEKMDTIISASPIEPELVEKFYNVRRKMYVVPPGVDIDYFKPEAKQRKINVPERYVFTTGRIEWTKGFDLLVSAFASVVASIDDISLLIGGGSTKPTRIEIDVRKKIDSIARELGISEKVIQIGRISNEDLPAYYAKSELVVLPSRYDLFGMVAIEALACGKPVIVSKYAGVYKIIARDFGIVVDPLNKEELADRIIYLLRNPDIRKQMGLKGREFVERKMIWQNLAKDLKNIYDKEIQKISH